MEIILLEKIRNLGDLGDMVSVKSGYGRNYLIPQGKAVQANAQSRAEFEARRAELEAASAAALAAAEQRKQAIVNVGEISITARESGDGKLFGSVGVHEIVDALAAKQVSIEKREVLLPEGPIREIGEFEINIALHTDVVAPLKILVVAEEA
jgi:large subunit ribosomal protein L9